MKILPFMSNFSFPPPHFIFQHYLNDKEKQEKQLVFLKNSNY